LLAIEADLSRSGIGLVVLSMGGERLDTRNPTSKLMLTILAGVATWEREIMLERQREGIAKAKAAGKYNGRGPDQAAEGRVGSRCDREASWHRPEFGLPPARVGSGVQRSEPLMSEPDFTSMAPNRQNPAETAMFNSSIPDVVVGLVFSFLALSLATGAVVEAISSILQPELRRCK
jgi:hypothetical protein